MSVVSQKLVKNTKKKGSQTLVKSLSTNVHSKTVVLIPIAPKAKAHRNQSDRQHSRSTR